MIFCRENFLSRLLVLAVLPLSVVFLFGCESIKKQQITRERCESLDYYNMGLVDGTEAQRRGLKLESWKWDCKSFKIVPKEDDYNKGYDIGIDKYCSCENGFASGIRAEIGELKGQYYVCGQERKNVFFWAHEQGQKFENDKEMVFQRTAVDKGYHDDKILAKATEICAQRPANAAPEKKLLGEGESGVPRVGTGSMGPGSPIPPSTNK